MSSTLSGQLISKSTSEVNTRPLSLVGLLEEKQPYKQLFRLDDAELSKLSNDDRMLSKIQGSLIGLAVGDALGAPVEFRPYSYMLHNRVTDMQGGGTWGLQAGQWTDDTSMALCLAASLIVKGDFDGYDQLVRYKQWFRHGYMSSTGECFDIGAATRTSITEFESRQRQFTNSEARCTPVGQTGKENGAKMNFATDCGDSNAAGNGPLMRLAPVPLFYHLSKETAIQKAACSASLTHGDPRALDACRFYAALIWYAINGSPKDQLLDSNLYQRDFKPPLHPDVQKIVQGCYKEKKKGYDDGIRGTGFVLDSLEAALWAFYTDGDSFERGVLAAVNLGDDTDTTAAIYGQLAGAVYGLEGIPDRWRKQIFQREFIVTVANGLYLKGKNFDRPKRKSEVVNEGESNETAKKQRISSGKEQAEGNTDNR